METLDAAEVAALAGISRDALLTMHLALGIQPAADRRPDLPLPADGSPRDTGPRWDRAKAEQWAAEWLRVGAETQSEIDAAEKAARDAHSDRERILAGLVPAETYGVPVFSLATLPAARSRPDHYLLVRQEPLRYDHGRLLTPRYVIEGYIADSMVLQVRLLQRGSDVLPRSIDIVNTLGTAAIELGTPQIRRWKTLYDMADPTLWRETAADLQALMANQMTRLFGDLRRESTAKHLGLDGRAKDGGLNNLDKKLGRARQLDEDRDLARLTRARQLASLLGIDLDVDLRQ